MKTLTRLALALSVLAAPAAGEEWYDHYERGVKALAQKDGPAAATAFERAIRHRPSPGDNVITYGTNRLSAYHPYLRLAEAHLLAGHPETAREALVRSAERAKEPAEERDAL